jgi:predicted alpha/beta hydrolase
MEDTGLLGGIARIRAGITRNKATPAMPPLSAANAAPPGSLEQLLSLAARDGYELGAALYDVENTTEPAHAAVFCCGGGIPARVYRRFAAWLAARGIPVLIFDYRGIGRSRPSTIRGLAAAIEDWAELDCAAAIAWLRKRYPRAELIGIAHSVGGLVLASAPNAPELRRFLMIGVHTGYCGDYHPRWRIPMTVMWHYLMPALVSVVGYFPGRALRIGEDLPSAFARQWSGRRTPEFDSGGAARVAECIARCRELEGRALALTFTDDGFATVEGARRLMGFLPRIAFEHRVIAPSDVGLPSIGHFGFFRQSAEGALWPPVAAWLAG